MDLSTPVASLTSAVGSTSTGVPKLVGDLAPLITIGVIIGLFLSLLGRVLHV